MRVLRGRRIVEITGSRRRDTANSTTEDVVKKQIKEYLDLVGAYYFMPVVTAWGKRGLDFHCCIRGWHVGIEAKAPGKKPTPIQLATMRDMRDAGGIAFWADNVETVKENIRWLLTHGSPRG